MQTSEFTVDAMIRCVDREIRFRERTYQRQIDLRHISHRDAAREIACMKSVLVYITRAQAVEELAIGLACKDGVTREWFEELIAETQIEISERRASA